LVCSRKKNLIQINNSFSLMNVALDHPDYPVPVKCLFSVTIYTNPHQYVSFSDYHNPVAVAVEIVVVVGAVVNKLQSNMTSF